MRKITWQGTMADIVWHSNRFPGNRKLQEAKKLADASFDIPPDRRRVIARKLLPMLGTWQGEIAAKIKSSLKVWGGR